MSIEKLKIFKKALGADHYSKNPIIDSLIRQKLHSQMIVIKDNFQQIIVKEPKTERRSNLQSPLRRKLSTHNLGSLNSQKIKESLNYRHSIDKSALDFIIQRQKSSPFFSMQDIESNNIVRTNHDDFLNKIRSSEDLTYPNNTTPNTNLKNLLPLDIWLNELPQVEQIIRTRAQQLQKEKRDPKITPFNFSTNRPSTQSLEPIKSRLSRQAKLIPSKIEQITYDSRRFHKNDYKGLEAWFQKMNEKNSLKNVGKQESQMKEHLNQTYQIYLCAIKELIRLTYIQSAQKGLLLQKIIWSLIRLFEELISEQHRTNYEQFKIYSNQIKQMKQNFIDRNSFLQSQLQRHKKLVSSLSETKRNTYLSYLSYKKVNQQMNHEILSLVGQIKNLNAQNNLLISNMSKIIHQFHSRDLINTKRQENYTIYFYLNSMDKIEVVAKVPNRQILEQYFESSMISFNLEQVQNKQSDKKIEQLDNQLNAYWSKKKAYLDLDQIIDKHNQPQITDFGIQVDGKGYSTFQDAFTQFPQQNQLSFEDFLRNQMEEQRKIWQQKQGEYKETNLQLKQVYRQAYEQIQLLTAQNKKFKQKVEQKDRQITLLEKRLQKNDSQISHLKQNVRRLEQQIQEMTQKYNRSSVQLQKLTNDLAYQTKRCAQEKDNNSLLANNIYDLKLKIQQAEELRVKTQESLKLQLQQAEQKFKTLQGKIRKVAPYLQKMMLLADESGNQILTKLSSLVEKNLKQYVQKDSKVFLTY